MNTPTLVRRRVVAEDPQQQRCLDGPGAEGVDPDPLTGELNRYPVFVTR